MTHKPHPNARTRGLALCALVLALAFAIIAFGAATAPTHAAQPDDLPGNETEDDATEIEDQLGDLVIHSYEYDSDTEEFEIRMTWTGQGTQQVALNEYVELDGAGTTQISMQQQRLSPQEETTVTISARETSSGYAAVMLTSQQSVENGDGLVIQSDEPSRSWGTIAAENAMMGLVGMALITGAAITVVAYRRLTAEETGRERIL